MIPGFITLTDQMGGVERIRVGFINQYWRVAEGSHLMLGNREQSELYEESPEEIGAKIREAYGIPEPGFTRIPLSESLPSEGEK